MALVQYIQNQRDRNRVRRPRIFRDRTNPLDVYDDTDILRRFRMSRITIFEVIDLISADIEHATDRNHAISPTIQTLCALRYYATGNFQKVTGDIHGISQPSVSRIINRVSRALCRKAAQVIRFPPSTCEELQRVSAGFFEKYGFPGVIGCIDGSLIRIKAPSVDEPIYVCRKNYHALNIQGICDVEKKFTNLVARWPGSTHDAYIWSNCTLNAEFENGANGGLHLLGNSAYPLRPYLLTPFLAPGNDGEERFNRCQRATRQSIESTFGCWKMRWMSVHDFGGAMTLRPSRCIRVMVATAMLHNICQDHGVPLPDDAQDLPDENPDEDIVHVEAARPENPDGRRVRDAIVRGHFM